MASKTAYQKGWEQCLKLNGDVWNAQNPYGPNSTNHPEWNKGFNHCFKAMFISEFLEKLNSIQQQRPAKYARTLEYAGRRRNANTSTKNNQPIKKTGEEDHEGYLE